MWALETHPEWQMDSIKTLKIPVIPHIPARLRNFAQCKYNPRPMYGCVALGSWWNRLSRRTYSSVLSIFLESGCTSSLIQSCLAAVQWTWTGNLSSRKSSKQKFKAVANMTLHSDLNDIFSTQNPYVNPINQILSRYGMEEDEVWWGGQNFCWLPYSHTSQVAKMHASIKRGLGNNVVF